MIDDINIQDALKNAKYNEAVIVTISEAPTIYEQGPRIDSTGHNDRSRELVLIPSLDVKNGGVIWNDANTSSVEKDLDIGIMRHIRTKKWVTPMLNDAHRNSLYDNSIKKGITDAIRELSNQEEADNDSKTLRILDIGSGTGLLGMMAARHSSDIVTKVNQSKANIESISPISVTVCSVEMASAMSRLARKTIKGNDLQDIIQVIDAHSSDQQFNPFSPTSAKAHVCISELLESGLLREGIIPAMRDAWQRHLCEGAIVIPQKARVFAQVIESSWITNLKGPNKFQGPNLSASTDDSRGVLLGGNVIIPIHSESLFHDLVQSEFVLGMSPSDTDSIEEAKLLTEPSMVLEFDFTCPENIPTEEGRSIKNHLTAIESGKCHGILFWWEIDLYGETYTVGDHWQDHWQQCVFVLSSDNEFKYQDVQKDEMFSLISSHDDANISFKIEKQTSECKTQPHKRHKVVENILNHITSDRALQLNDVDRVTKLSKAIKTAMEVKGTDAAILDVSDFSLCSLIAATEFNASNVTSIESTSADIPMLSAMISQIGNSLPKNGHQFQILNAHLESISLDYLNGSPVDIVMSEMYYEMLSGWNLATALNYLYTVKSLKQRGLVKQDAVSVPSYALIKCCAVELHNDVVNAHCGLSNESICSFNHKDAMNYSQKFHTYDMIFPLWQYKWKRLSDTLTIAKIDYEGEYTAMTIKGDGEWSNINFSRSGRCHAIVHWVDYGVKVESSKNENKFEEISTGNRFHKQSLRMMSTPMSIQQKDIGILELSVKPVIQSENKGIEDYTFEINVMKK